jgi:hypothetical protein
MTGTFDATVAAQISGTPSPGGSARPPLPDQCPALSVLLVLPQSLLLSSFLFYTPRILYTAIVPKPKRPMYRQLKPLPKVIWTPPPYLFRPPSRLNECCRALRFENVYQPSRSIYELPWSFWVAGAGMGSFHSRTVFALVVMVFMCLIYSTLGFSHTIEPLIIDDIGR